MIGISMMRVNKYHDLRDVVESQLKTSEGILDVIPYEYRKHGKIWPSRLIFF
jgi:hypothetical protein